MFFPLYIAKRYLFSTQKNHIINWVSFISVCGVAVGTMALVCVLSVFNGFQHVIEGMFSSFDPPLQITATHGKSFEPDSIAHVLYDSRIEAYCEVIQENAMLCYADKQVPVLVKGVSKNYSQVNAIDSILIDGSFSLDDKYVHTAVAGIGLARTMGMSVHFVEPMWFYVPKREGKVNMLQPEKSFYREFAYLSGIFMVQQEKYDHNMVFVSLNLARKMYEYPTAVTAVELRLKPGVDEAMVQEQWQELLGDDYKIQNRYQQQAEFYNMLQIEKWVTYFILSFILLIAVFNIIGSLSMLIIDKQDDVKILLDMGATPRVVRQIFLFEGWLIAIVGAVMGVLLGLLLCYLQSSFGLITLGSGQGFVIQAYPVRVVWSDVLIIFSTVVIMGFFAAVYPSKYFYSHK